VATVTEFRQHAGQLLASVKAGDEVVITLRGTPAARLVGVRQPDARIDGMVGSGALKRGTGRLGRDFWDLPRPADPEGRVLEALIAERRGP
jgi:prevent-host-death family protein